MFAAAPRLAVCRHCCRRAALSLPAETLYACRVYDVWAKYRLPITGRPDLAVVLQEKKACGAAKDGSSCELP